MSEDGFRSVGTSQSLVDNDVQPFYVRDRKLRLNIARVDGELYAFAGLCAHQHCPLSAGLLSGKTIVCQCHGSRYDLRTGAVLRGPATEWLAIYEVREVQGELQIKIRNDWEIDETSERSSVQEHKG